MAKAQELIRSRTRILVQIGLITTLCAKSHYHIASWMHMEHRSLFQFSQSFNELS